MKSSSSLKKKKISIILNSKGSVFNKIFKFLPINKYEFQIICNKKNSLKKFRNKKNIKYNFVPGSNKLFNKKAKKKLYEFEPDKVILFYTKKITKEIHKNFLVINIHNSYLPFYKGLGAIKNVMKNKNKLFSSTMHIVNEKFDSGEIISQCASPLEKNNIKYVKKEAFNQRVILFLEALNYEKSKKGRYLYLKKYIINPSFLNHQHINILKKII